MKKKEYHGLTKHPLFWVLDAIKQRCNNKKHKHYKNYGGRGISVCNEWLNSTKSFYDWAINNGYAPGLSIDRINNNGNYQPDNCRWVTQREQMNNTRQNRIILINDELKTLKQWCNFYKIDYDLVSNRLNQHNWPKDKIFRKTKYKHLV